MSSTPSRAKSAPAVAPGGDNLLAFADFSSMGPAEPKAAQLGFDVQGFDALAPAPAKPAATPSADLLDLM